LNLPTPNLLDPRGPIAAAEKTILLDSLAIMLAIVIPTILLTLAFAWWFRASNRKAVYRPKWAFSGSIEIVVWFIPLLTITLLGGVTWIGSHRLDPARPIESAVPPLHVQVVSLDWKWLFVYPEQGVATVNELVVPAGTPLRLSLTSGSVLNTFFVPQLGSMLYTMNGMSNTLWLQADKPGTFRGQSGHYSGDGFSDMVFRVRALPRDEFRSWASAVKSGGGVTLDEGRYLALAKQSSPVPPGSWPDVDADLYDRIVSQAIPPAPGPPADRGGAGTQPAPTSTSKPRAPFEHQRH
jgi:cytochrome o ubiquinol oxidase subunit 2